MKKIQNKPVCEQQSATRGFRPRWSLLLFMTVIWAGCKPAVRPAADSNPAGTYALVSVNGQEVPCTIQHEGASPTIKSGAFVISSDGTCSSKVVFSMPGGGDGTREVKASYARQGPTLTMKWEGAGTTTGTVEGDTFKMNNEGMIFVYRK